MNSDDELALSVQGNASSAPTDVPDADRDDDDDGDVAAGAGKPGRGGKRKGAKAKAANNKVKKNLKDHISSDGCLLSRFLIGVYGHGC